MGEEKEKSNVFHKMCLNLKYFLKCKFLIKYYIFIILFILSTPITMKVKCDFKC